MTVARIQEPASYYPLGTAPRCPCGRPLAATPMPGGWCEVLCGCLRRLKLTGDDNGVVSVREVRPARTRTERARVQEPRTRGL